MYCVIQAGGKQLRVCKGQIIKIEKVTTQCPESKLVFHEVLLVSNNDVSLVGQPLVTHYEVIGQIINEQKDPKIIVFKKKKRKGYCRKNGHRQTYSMVKILDIVDKSQTVSLQEV